MKKIISLSILLSIFLVFGCDDGEQFIEKNELKKLKVSSTTGIISDAIINIAGDKIDLIATICGPGIDPHSYIPTTKDIVRISKSDIIFYNGLNLEAKMGDILATLGKKKAIAIGEAIPTESLISNSGKSEILDYDPHVWNSPLLWIYSVNMIIDILCERDFENETYYRENGKKYIDSIYFAYNYAKEKYSQIPAVQRVLISEHDAFQYFAKAYNFEVLSVLGMNTESEAGIKVIQQLSDFVVKNKVKSAFVETTTNNKGIQALQNAVKSRNHNLKIAKKPLYSDALGQYPPTNTYIGFIRYNADVIYEALK